MSISKQNKCKNKNIYQQDRKIRPKPQWSTDFIDRSQYKLSQIQMIHKKAALQSKHRQQAKQELQQRRKKLQMGIIDEQTRKIYQTALISKNIDINPPLRKNLTEMIKYQKQRKYQQNENQGDYGSENQEEYDPQTQSQKDIKQAQDFIKKFEKAKKQQKIQRAVQILTTNKFNRNDIQNERQSTNQNGLKINNFLNEMSNDIKKNKKSQNYKQKSTQDQKSFSQEEAISSIQDTIRFMQQKLFAAKKTVEQHSKSFISQDDEDDNQQFGKRHNKNIENYFTKPSKDQNLMFKKGNKKALDLNIKQNKNKIANYDEENENIFGDQIAQISQLKIKFNHQNEHSSDDQCLDTIRRMREMMQNNQFGHEEIDSDSRKLKQNIRMNASPTIESLQCNSTIQKNPHDYSNESQAEVSFNLTVNNDDQYQRESSMIQKSKINSKRSNKFVVDNKIRQSEKIGFAKGSNKIQKQDQYEQQYQKIKQNLFNSINQNKTTNKFSKHFNQEDDDSEDSLMIKDKINLWKKQLQHQIEPDDQEEMIIKENKAVKGNNQFKNYRDLVKQNQDQDDDQAYKYNLLNQKDKYKFTNKDQSINNSVEMSQNQNEYNKTWGNTAKKPPLSKKGGRNNAEFENMKNMISKASTEINKIEIQPLRIQPINSSSDVLGFDFRGSINIKKNILSK